MNTPIVFTPPQLWSLLISICGAIITLSAAFAAISGIIAKLKEPDRKQNERIDRLEKKVEEHSAKLGRDMERLETLERASNATLSGILAIIRHERDGNNLAGLKAEEEKISRFLMDEAFQNRKEAK